ncbi:FeoA family protein [Desulfobacca acetoxidans]|uniref:FeoA family protein n=1 Tax=Desulfobacca acetoxidans (strain ATCC 700848 / DSM 11109 / ASRB2) TaxID=880072 RepID=F2NJS8_DESAR|nr:FeoA family protein [Desulfobacca acetoxidans]AEB09733.1 FeoA family protein [Desulfobacca acetoxidans DSM 11109]
MPDTPTPQVVQPLTLFSAGQAAMITGFTGGRRMQERVVALGLYPGQRITICQNNGNSLVIGLNGCRLILGGCVSQKILALPAGDGRCNKKICPCWEKAIKDAG